MGNVISKYVHTILHERIKISRLSVPFAYACRDKNERKLPQGVCNMTAEVQKQIIRLLQIKFRKQYSDQTAKKLFHVILHF